MVEERKRMVLRQSRQPERELGEVNGHRVPVDPVEAALGNNAAGVEELVLVVRNLWDAVLCVPGSDQGLGQLAAGFDEEGTGAHRRVADLEVEDLLGPGTRPKLLEDRPE